MTTPQKYPFPRYLSSKKSVDDRALNQHVWQTLAGELSHRASLPPLRVLEIGAGIGTMIERMLERKLLAQVEYTALDAQAENIASARQRLPDWGREHGYPVAEGTDGGLVLQRENQPIAIHFEASDLFDFISRQQGPPRWDLLVAHAFLDLMDIPAALPRIFSLAAQDGLFYFSINFDGATLLEPAIDLALDDLIQSLYHRTMDERLTGGKPSGDSRAGRHLFTHLVQAGALILDAGASDWVVFPGPNGYPQDEAYFLHFIIHTIHHALVGCAELDARRFAAWTAERHAQIKRGELVYIAHQLDFVGRVNQKAGTHT